MNARTKLKPDGDVAIPSDVLKRLNWTPGMALEIAETRDGLTLSVERKSAFPPTTIEDLRALPKYKGPTQSIEQISRLSDEDIRRLID